MLLWRAASEDWKDRTVVPSHAAREGAVADALSRSLSDDLAAMRDLPWRGLAIWTLRRTAAAASHLVYPITHPQHSRVVIPEVLQGLHLHTIEALRSYLSAWRAASPPVGRPEWVSLGLRGRQRRPPWRLAGRCPLD